MFSANLDSFKINQIELHRQAEHYRLVRSLEKPTRLSNRLFGTVGRILISAGQNLIQRTQAAH